MGAHDDFAALLNILRVPLTAGLIISPGSSSNVHWSGEAAWITPSTPTVALSYAFSYTEKNPCQAGVDIFCHIDEKKKSKATDRFNVWNNDRGDLSPRILGYKELSLILSPDSKEGISVSASG